MLNKNINEYIFLHTAAASWKRSAKRPLLRIGMAVALSVCFFGSDSKLVTPTLITNFDASIPNRSSKYNTLTFAEHV